MIQIDYNGYLNGQTEWAKSLLKQSKRLHGIESRQLSIQAYNVMKRASKISQIKNFDTDDMPTAH